MGSTDLPAMPSARPAGTSRSARSFGTHLLIGELIGRGGMSRVFRGWVRDTGQEVAVKVLRDDLASRPDAVHRFIRERELLATVASPHVVQVHDLVVHGDELGIVMDLVPGGHLRRAVAFPCDLGQAARLAAQIADGLAAVHAAGVVHRDLKPENVLVETEPDGALRLRLTDFGISRLVDSAALTQTQVTGTPGYLSPEVAAGGKVTAAADVYALGIMLYELCTGRQPFLAENPLLLVLAHTRQEPPRPVGMPDDLWVLLARMLAKDAAGRPRAAQLAMELRALAPSLDGLPPCSVPAAPPVEVAAPATVAAPELPGPGRRSPYETGTSPATGRGGQTPGRQGPGRQGPGRQGPGDQDGAGYLLLNPDDGRPAYGHGPHPGVRGGARATRRADARDGRPAGLPVPKPVLVGGALAAVAALVFGIVLATTRAGGSDDPTIRLGPPEPPTSSSPAAQVTAVLPELTSAAAAPPRRTATTTRTSGAKASTGASTTAPTGASTTTTAPSPTVAPDQPTLERIVRSAEDRHSSDRHATLAIGHVAAGSGDVRSVTVRWSGAGDGRQDVPLRGNGAATDYDVTVNGLVNGTEYTFTVDVCNSGGRCTTSAAVRFTPYGAPTVVAPSITAAGQVLTVTVRPVVRNANPGTTACSVSVTGSPADPGAPSARSVRPDGETLTFVGKAATTYVAVETCSTSEVSDGSATSAPLHTGAA